MSLWWYAGIACSAFPGYQLDHNRRARSENSIRTILYLAIVALIATSSCSSSDSSSNSGSELPADAEQVIRDNMQAGEDQDVDAWYATLTDDHFHRRYLYGADSQNLLPEETEEDASNVAFNIEFHDKAEATPGEEWIVTGDGPWFVSMRQSWIDEHFQWDGNATYVVVDKDGNMKIASHYYTGTMQERQS